MGKSPFTNVLILTLLGIVVIMVAPMITGVIRNSQSSSALTMAETTTTEVQNLYMTLNVSGIVELPFVVEFDGANQDIYSNNHLMEDVQFSARGRVPRSGTVIINTDSSVFVKDLKVSGGYICNKNVRRIC